jgi:hypothetical protein
MARKSAPRAVPPGRFPAAGFSAGVALIFLAACGGDTPANLGNLPTESTSLATPANPFQSAVPTPLATEPPTLSGGTPIPTTEASETPDKTFAVKFASLTTPIQSGRTATAKIETKPRAKCSIEVDYKSGPSTAAGLGPKTAKASGVVSWSWMVGFNTSAGRWPVTVACSLGNASGSATRYLTVR